MTGFDLIFGDTIKFDTGFSDDLNGLADQNLGSIATFFVDVELDGTGDDTIKGGSGNNVLIGGGGSDTIDGGADADGLDFIFGNGGARDTLRGHGGPNVIFGGNGTTRSPATTAGTSSW